MLNLFEHNVHNYTVKLHSAYSNGQFGLAWVPIFVAPILSAQSLFCRITPKRMKTKYPLFVFEHSTNFREGLGRGVKEARDIASLPRSTSPCPRCKLPLGPLWQGTNPIMLNGTYSPPALQNELCVLLEQGHKRFIRVFRNRQNDLLIQRHGADSRLSTNK